MKRCLLLALALCLLVIGCGGEPTPTPDLETTRVAAERAGYGTMTTEALILTSTAAITPTATVTLTFEAPTATHVPTGTPTATHTPSPTITCSLCPGNVVVNGGFERGLDGWYQHTTGTGWKARDLISSDYEGFQPYDGHYLALLGGFEGVYDTLTQTVTIPAEGQLCFWWHMQTSEFSYFPDYLRVELVALDGSGVELLALHDAQEPEGNWQEEVVDVSAHGGQTFVLRFLAYNDGHLSSSFYIDQVCLFGSD